MKILLIGARGQLAHDLSIEFGRAPRRYEVVPVTHEQLEIRDAKAVEKLVKEARPQCIVNTAAFHRVDLCEDEPENAFAVNEGGVLNLARAAQSAAATLVQLSTDYVFDGKKRSPYVESDGPRPISVYGKSRLAGERVVQQTCESYMVVRTCGLYGAAGSRSKAGNFVETMLKLAAAKKSIQVVDDQVCTPTSTAELAARMVPLLREVVEERGGGVFHLTNRGECSWFQFAQEVFRLAGASVDLSPVSTAAYAAKARRPPYSVLENAALLERGFEDFSVWPAALAAFMRARMG